MVAFTFRHTHTLDRQVDTLTPPLLFHIRSLQILLFFFSLFCCDIFVVIAVSLHFFQFTAPVGSIFDESSNYTNDSATLCVQNVQYVFIHVGSFFLFFSLSITASLCILFFLSLSLLLSFFFAFLHFLQNLTSSAFAFTVLQVYHSISSFCLRIFFLSYYFIYFLRTLVLKMSSPRATLVRFCAYLFVFIAAVAYVAFLVYVRVKEKINSFGIVLVISVAFMCVGTACCAWQGVVNYRKAKQQQQQQQIQQEEVGGAQSRVQAIPWSIYWHPLHLILVIVLVGTFGCYATTKLGDGFMIGLTVALMIIFGVVTVVLITSALHDYADYLSRQDEAESAARWRADDVTMRAPQNTVTAAAATTAPADLKPEPELPPMAQEVEEKDAAQGEVQPSPQQEAEAQVLYGQGHLYEPRPGGDHNSTSSIPPAAVTGGKTGTAATEVTVHPL